MTCWLWSSSFAKSAPWRSSQRMVARNVLRSKNLAPSLLTQRFLTNHAPFSTSGLLREMALPLNTWTTPETTMTTLASTIDAKKSRDDEAPLEGPIMRIAKRMAMSSTCSRREAEALILAGRVTLNHTVLNDPAVNVTMTDVITVDAKPLTMATKTKIWIAHKLPKELVSATDPAGRATIFDRFRVMGLPKHLMPVGRLDFMTEGLLVLTNDGDLARRLEHPTQGIRRVYQAVVRGTPCDWKIQALARGVTVNHTKYKPITVNVTSQDGKDYWLKVIVHEGKNREVRNALASVKFVVKRLIRTEFGPYKLSALKPGNVQEVHARHVKI